MKTRNQLLVDLQWRFLEVYAVAVPLSLFDTLTAPHPDFFASGEVDTCCHEWAADLLAQKITGQDWPDDDSSDEEVDDFLLHLRIEAWKYGIGVYSGSIP